MRLAYVFLSILAIGCKTNRSSEVCDADFDAFFKKFASDSVFQKKHMDFPVMAYYSDEDFPLDLMERMVDEENYTFTDFRNERNAYKISLEKTKDSAFYWQKGINSGHNITYKFAYQDDCWKLVEIRDMTD